MKSYIFHYWFAFPAISFPNKSYFLQKTTNINEIFNAQQVNTTSFVILVNFFWVEIFLKCEQFMKNLNKFYEKNVSRPSFFAIDFETLEILTVKQGLEVYNTNETKRIMFSYYDPNSQSNHPCWSLRNYLALLSLKW